MRQLSEREYAQAFDSFIALSKDTKTNNVNKFKEEFLYRVNNSKAESGAREQYIADLTILLKLANKYHRKTDPTLALFLKTNALQTSVIYLLLDDELKEKLNNNQIVIHITLSLLEQCLQKERMDQTVFHEIVMQGLNVFENILLKNF